MISTRLQLSLSILILILFPSVIVEGFTTTIVNSPIINTKTGRSSIVVPTRRPFTTLRCMECNRRKWPLIIRDATNNYHVESDPIYQEKKKKQKKASLQLIQGVHPLLSKSWTKLRRFIHKPTHKAASYIVAVLLMFTVLLTPLSDALAAPSGGRMGGSFGGGGRSRSGSGSGSSYSRSYSAPSRSSYNRGYSRGLNSGYNSRPNIIVAPPLGVMGSSSPIYYAPGADSVAIVRRDSSIVDTFLLYFFILFAILTFKNGNDIADDATSSSILGEGVSVAQISVALNVPDRDSLSSVLTYLNRLSQTAKTDSRVGVSNLVSQGKKRRTYSALNSFHIDCHVQESGIQLIYFVIILNIITLFSGLGITSTKTHNLCSKFQVFTF